MAALDFTDRAAVLAYVTAALPDADSTMLEALLDASAADDCADTPTTTYRPFWLIGNILQSNPETLESVRSAAGSQVAYRDPLAAYQALMQRQAALDQALCNVPTGFEAVAAGGVGTATLTRAYG